MSALRSPYRQSHGDPNPLPPFLRCQPVGVEGEDVCQLLRDALARLEGEKHVQIDVCAVLNDTTGE